MGNKTSNDSIVSSDTKRVGALKKYLAKVRTEIPVDGKLLKPAGVTALFQASLDTQAAVTAARAAYKAALAACDEAKDQRKRADDALKSWVLNRFGADSVEAHEFGYSARKIGEVSAADRANAVLLSAATRKARGTMGKRQKEKIKGTLGTVAAPPTSPPSPSVMSGAEPAPPTTDLPHTTTTPTGTPQ